MANALLTAGVQEIAALVIVTSVTSRASEPHVRVTPSAKRHPS